MPRAAAPAGSPVACSWAAVVAAAQLPVAHLLTGRAVAVTAAAPAAGRCVTPHMVHTTPTQDIFILKSVIPAVPITQKVCGECVNTVVPQFSTHTHTTRATDKAA